MITLETIQGIQHFFNVLEYLLRYEEYSILNKLSINVYEGNEGRHKVTFKSLEDNFFSVYYTAEGLKKDKDDCTDLLSSKTATSLIDLHGRLTLSLRKKLVEALDEIFEDNMEERGGYLEGVIFTILEKKQKNGNNISTSYEIEAEYNNTTLHYYITLTHSNVVLQDTKQQLAFLPLQFDAYSLRSTLLKGIAEDIKKKTV